MNKIGFLSSILILSLGFPACRLSGRVLGVSGAEIFSPFKTDLSGVTHEALLDAYAKWHTDTLADESLGCEDLKGIIMAVEEGGIGYTANLIFPMLLKAMETGRLFFCGLASSLATGFPRTRF